MVSRDELLYRPAVSVVVRRKASENAAFSSAQGTEFSAAEMIDFGLTAWQLKVTIKGCRASDARTGTTLFDN
jgi:hypothetical protein